MPWIADPTPGFSSVRIQKEILDPWGIFYSIRYGFGTIEVELTNTKEWRFAHDVAEDMRSQGIETEVIETRHDFLIHKISKDVQV